MCEDRREEQMTRKMTDCVAPESGECETNVSIPSHWRWD